MNHQPAQPPGFILARVARDGECWIWQLSLDRDGYGRLTVYGGKDRRAVAHRAHRVAYEAFIGPIPTGLTLDHLCRNRACVNPDHLEPVTVLENVRRQWAAKRAAAGERAA